jgi:Tfp pilus assembly protein PilO
MNFFKKKFSFVPEGKEYLVWFFLILFLILLFQYFLYPIIKKVDDYKLLDMLYRSEIKEVNEKIAHSISKKKEQEELSNFLKGKLSYTSQSRRNLQDNLKNETAKSFNFSLFEFEEPITTSEIVILPLNIEFLSSKNDMIKFMDNLFAISLPIDILDLQIVSLSANRFSVKIQLFLMKGKENELYGY